PAGALELAARLRGMMPAKNVLLCASTREGEEELILDAWKAAPPTGTMLVVVPRHPQRFNDVARLIEQRGMQVIRRSSASPAAADSDVSNTVFLGDSMGEMFAYYGACDIACVGGSLQPLGGQN